MRYRPSPIATQHVELSADLAQLLEVLAKNTHEVWAQRRIAEGWRFGPHRDDWGKKHPCLIPYEDLPESEKEVDRQAAAETIKAICAMGYRISKS